MAAKFYICMLLVVLVSSAVLSARLRRPQEKEKTYNFLYKRFFDGPVTLEPTTGPPSKSFFIEVEHDTCFFASNGNSEKILIPRWGSEKNCESQDGNFEAFKAHGA